MSDGTYHTVARVGDISPGQGLPFVIGDRVIAIFLDEGTYYATDDACPHKGAPLCDGIVYDKTVTCTWHCWTFRLDDGRWTGNLSLRIGTYPVRVIGDEIQVALDESRQ